MTDTHDPDKPDATEPDETPDAEPAPKRGRMSFQDADTTKPREPTLAEQRARRKAIEEEAERELEEAARTVEVERKAKTRRRIMIGSGVTVGVVALVAVWYQVASPNEVTANCVSTEGSVLAGSEDYCDERYVTSHGGHYNSVGGFWVIPLATGGFGQYQYNYGGTVGPGGRVTGGSATAPSGRTTVKTSSGKTVQRGGFGISSGGKGGSGGS